MGLKFNPFTGNFDIVKEDNFSYKTVVTNKTVKIPTNQQMVIVNEMTVDGTLVVDGEVAVINTTPVIRLVNTNQSESINIQLYEVIRQTASGITTSLSGAIEGSYITITNRSGGDNTLNITIQGTASPTIKNLETFSLVYNGTDYDFT